MDMTIEKLKIGAPLAMGKYGVLNDSTPQPIIWLKGTPNSDFITQLAVDYLCFDAPEPETNNYMGNPNYRMSNLLSFLNSEEEVWYHPMHRYDTPPGHRVYSRSGAYERHYGFLYYFEGYELSSIQSTAKEVNGEEVASLVRLPSSADIIGAEKFKLFVKKGVRPKGAEDFIHNKRMWGFDYGSYIPFWVSDTNRNGYASFVNRSGYIEAIMPREESGVRPVCSIKPNVQVTQDEYGIYHIVPQHVYQNVCTDEELFAFLGMAQP